MTPYGRVASVMIVPQVSMRTVLPHSGDVSRNGLVRTTYIGVLAISASDWSVMPPAVISVPNQVRKSGLSEAMLSMNSQRPSCSRNAHSVIMFSMHVTMGPKNTA
jgi:hypothetical protein